MERESLRTFDGRPGGRRWVARSMREELDAAALDGRFGAEPPMRIEVPLGVAIVGRVGEDQDAPSSALLGVIDLQAAEDLAVASQYDLFPNVDPQLLQSGEVVRTAVIHVDDLTRRLAGDAISVERAE